MSETEIFQYARNCQTCQTCPKTRRGKWNKTSNTSAGICDYDYNHNHKHNHKCFKSISNSFLKGTEALRAHPDPEGGGWRWPRSRPSLRQRGFSKTLDPYPHDQDQDQWCHRLWGEEHLGGGGAYWAFLGFLGLLGRRRRLLPLHQRGLDWPRGGGQLQSIVIVQFEKVTK